MNIDNVQVLPLLGELWRGSHFNLYQNSSIKRQQNLHCLISLRDPMLLEPFWHMKPFVQYRSDIFLERKMLQKWKYNRHELIIRMLSSWKWNTRYSVQRLKNETEWIVVNNNDSAEIFWHTRKIFHMFSVFPAIMQPIDIRKKWPFRALANYGPDQISQARREKIKKQAY